MSFLRLRQPKGQVVEIASLPGKKGRDGVDGRDGADGKSAYELAVAEGFEGDLADWLASLKGESGGITTKVYEHIATITVAPDEDGSLPQHVIFSADSEGNPFELTDFYVHARAGFTDGTKSSLYMKTNGLSFPVLANASVSFTTTLRSNAILFQHNEIDGFLNVFATESMSSQGVWNSQSNIRKQIVIPPSDTERFLPVTSIDLYTLLGDNKTWVEGSTFELWGVRVGSEGSGTIGGTGAGGKSAYELAVAEGFEGDLDEWLSSLKGKDGYTPVKGVDYFTPTDKAEWSEHIASELAKRGQIKPEFVNSTDECTDTNLLYVLPDGNVYAYTSKTVIQAPTNQIKNAIDSDGAAYNGGKGYKDGTRLSLSSGETAQNGYTATGFIEVKQGDTIRFDNIKTNSTDNNIFIVFYNKDFAWVGYLRNQSATDALSAGVCVLDSNLTLDSGTLDGAAYFRVSMLTNTSENYMITVNEPLEGHTTTMNDWSDTGHKFIPADYENDILYLKERVSALETSGGVESYVVEEAERVAKNVYSHQNANTFTFLAVADAHYLAADSNIVASNIHAGQGMDLVRKGVNVDFAVCLGDNGSGSGKEGSVNRATIEMGVAQIRAANATMESAFRGIPNFRTVGNHESLVFNYTFNGNDYLDSSELFPLYGAYNRGAVFHEGNKERGYCYRDFDDWKLRVICVNTSDIQDLAISDNTRDIYVSATQGQWFAETLDLSDKDNAAEWSVLILSHAPLDWGPACIYLCDILKAYNEGTTCNATTHEGVTISYDYAGKNAATIIGNCHGHNHNFQVDNLRRLIAGTTTTETISIKRFGIPNACFERTNEKGENDTTEVWDIEYGEDVSYEKIAGTARDTAFCVVTVDPVARKIYADCYGAGYDREISY